MSDRLMAQSSKLQIVLCGSEADYAAIRAAGWRSVRIVNKSESIYVAGADGHVIDPTLEMFTSFVLAFPRAQDGLRDALAVRLGDVRCRWVDFADGGTAASVAARDGADALGDLIRASRPMWTDEICLMSDVPDTDAQRVYTTGFDKLDEHGFRLVRPAFMPVVGPYGPLPGSAQFHTRYGWKRLDQWASGDEALVYDLISGSTKYEVVGRVVHGAPDGFVRLRNHGTTEITACANHRWPVVGKGGKRRVLTTEELAVRGCGEHGSGYSLIRTFSAPDLPDMQLTDAQIRLIVAVCADGHINLDRATNRITICVRKERKRERIVRLLDAANVAYRVRNYDSRPTEYIYDFDFRENKALAQFRNASPRQLEIVVDELQHWDGHVYENDSNSGRLVMSTSNAEDAAFLEYLYSACGYRASVFVQNGAPERQRDNYLVAANHRGRLARVHWSSVERGVPSEDGSKYCLTTTTGFFVCRLAPGQVYVTGNSGKSVLIRQLCCNLWRLHGWRALITSFEEKIKPRYQRDLRRHLIGSDQMRNDGEIVWQPKHHTDWTPQDIAAADAEVEKGFRFLRRKRNTVLDADRLVDRIEYAVRVYGVDVVVIDPVNEIDHVVPKGENKTDYMGRFIMKLKQIADDYDLLMIVCAHPPKEGVEKRAAKGRLMTLNDAADTAHYGNKADIGWCVWRAGLDERSPTYMHIDKLKDHEVMGKPTLAKLMLDDGLGRFAVTKIGYDAVGEELLGD